MAAPLTRTQLTAALRKWFPNGGYEFVTAVGRPGTFAPRGFTVHHTGGPYTDSDSYLKFLFETGRPDEGIPAQLCHFAVGASGRLYIGDTDNRANHAGMGSSSTRTKISTENYPGYTSEIEPGPDDINGNPEYYGVEVMYPGTLPMKPAQYAATVRLAAMIVDTYGWSALSVFAHREHTDRKWDPGQHSLVQFRKDVRALLANGPTGDDDMPGPSAWTEADWDAFDKKGVTLFWFRDINSNPDVTSPAWSTLFAMSQNVEQIEDLLRNPDALATAIAAKIPGGTVDVEVVKQGVREVLLEGVGTP